MKRTLYVAQLLSNFVAVGLLLAACAPAPTALPPTAVPTTVPPTLAPAATATANPPTATPGPVLATSAKLNNPVSVALDADGNLYFSTDWGIYTIDSTGMMRPFADCGGCYSGVYFGDGGPVAHVGFTFSPPIAFDRIGNLYVVDEPNNRIRRVDLNGTIDSVVGNGPVMTTQSTEFRPPVDLQAMAAPATEALLNRPAAVALDGQGNLYIMDSGNFRVRKVDPAGIITTIAGNGEYGYAGDGGPALEAEFGRSEIEQPYGLAVDAVGNVYVADTRNARIRMIDLDGIITTIAGTGEHGFSGDGGPATEAQLSNPTSLAFDAEGNLYFADETSGDLNQSHIRRVNTDGTIETIATDQRPKGEFSAGDGGIAVDAQGNVYYVDNANGLIKKVAPDGTITVVAGGGS